MPAITVLSTACLSRRNEKHVSRLKTRRSSWDPHKECEGAVADPGVDGQPG